MKRGVPKQVFSLLLALAMIAGVLPLSALPVHAGHRCPNCDEWIDGSPYCEGCYECDECCELCYECGLCTDCSGWEICSSCSEMEGGNICVDCAIDKDYHCPECYECYFKTGLWCDECGKCSECVTICDGCTANLGVGIICEECAVEKGSHCPECEGCYFAIQEWCQVCGLCAECVEICYYCTEITGEIICVECAVEEGLHCPECDGCYGDCGEEYCEECGICANCADICTTHGLCVECAIADGEHCPTCTACGEEAVICEGCGERCSECADDFCFNCNLCSDCVEVCPDCGSCSNCAEICPSCGEHCSECVGICDDCGLCLECCQDIAAMAGCDCPEWVCVESPDWNEHFEQTHTGTGSHSARPSLAWSWNAAYHWKACVYCDENEHYTSFQAHTFDANGKCTVCGYLENAKIQILEQPRDSRYALVSSPDEVYDEQNMAHFSVRAVGESELTYTWCRKVYSNGEWIYKPLTDPQPGENYEGPNLDILTFTDSCYDDTYLCCIITDEEGNEVRTVEVTLGAIHNYQYFEYYKTQETPFPTAQRSSYGHVLQCVGEGCDHVTNLRPHVDGDGDGYCDVCAYEIGSILVSKQPKNVSSVIASSPDEDYDESNIARFSVEAVGDSELTYTWCRRLYVNGQPTYQPLTNPGRLENYEGPELAILAPEDSCCNAYTYCCFISDEEGNEVKTIDVTLRAKHNYQYYKDYQSHETPYGYAKSKTMGHVLVCAGCGQVTRLRQHVDEDNDFCCDICDYTRGIFQVELSVAAPKEGQKPSYTVTSASPAYYAIGSSGNYTTYRRWYVSDNGEDGWTLMDKDTAFAAGKYYKISVDVCTAYGRAFGTYNDQPNLWANINGNYVLPKKMDGQDAAHYITVEYSFGVCNDSVIEDIQIVGITEPVAGEKPSYAYSILGAGYRRDADKNAFYEANWLKTPENWYYIKNGMGWFDLTKFDWLYENETFIPGHEYQAIFYLVTEDDYEFAHNKWYEPQVTASVNGYAAEAIKTGSDCTWSQQVQHAFTCPQKQISAVELELDIPRAERTPADYPVTSLAPAYYQPDPNYAFGGIYWYDEEGNMLEEDAKFVQGVHYKVEIKLVPAKADGTNTARFASPVRAYLNGAEVTQLPEWDAVYATNDAVYVYYTFTKGAYVAKNTGPATYTVSGTAAFWNDTDDAAYVLYESAVADADIRTAWKNGSYAALPGVTAYGVSKGAVAAGTVDGKAMQTQSFTFEGVADGSYKLAVFKPGKYVPKIVEVTVSGSDAALGTVKLWLYGDVNCDGQVKANDVLQINRYLNSLSSLFGSSDAQTEADRLLAADINGDGDVKANDVLQINRYLNSLSSLFNTIQ